MESETRPPFGRGARLATTYVVILAVGVLAYFLIRSYGRTLSAPAPNGPSALGTTEESGQVDVLLHVLVALLVIIAFARTLGAVFARWGQPPVIGEVVAGIILGPSALGRLAPDVSAFILPASVAPFLGLLAQVGVIVYMFLVGMELDPTLLRRRTHATVLISHVSIVAPFVLGVALALYLYPRFSTRDVPFDVFALFLGVSMAVTAFPVLARILTDRAMQKTRLGVLALSCAAIDDVTAWCLLAFLVSIVHSRAGGALLTAALTLGYIAFMIFAARPLVRKFVERQEGRGLTEGVLAVVCVALLLSSLITESIGIHAIFGAFLLGATVPHASRLARELTDRLQALVLVLFLPAFFALTGLRTELGLVHGAADWAVTLAIILVASVGKFGGSYAAARWTGLGSRDAAAIGILMNTRGLMELIVLNVGLSLGIISPRLFAMLVVMAVVTTLATTPILLAIGPDRGAEEA